MVEDDREENNLTAVSFDEPAWLELSLAWRRERGLSRAEQALVDFVIEHSAAGRPALNADGQADSAALDSPS